jgi:hypothetical protein
MEETKFTTFEPGANPTQEQNVAMMREQFEKLMARKPVAMVITAEFESGSVATGCVGAPATLEALAGLGLAQVLDMLKRGRESGENG